MYIINFATYSLSHEQMELYHFFSLLLTNISGPNFVVKYRGWKRRSSNMS